MDYHGLMAAIGTVIDVFGVLVIALGATLATARYILRRQGTPDRSYQRLRQDLGRAILLGLEFLIAGDIIGTIVVTPTLERLYVLGLIVLIRTFLSMALEVELEGRWPWQAEKNP